MMDKWQVLYNFWAQFGVPAYEENSVPDDAPYPRITYEAAGGGFGADLSLSASIWDKSTSTEFIDTLSDTIEKTIKSYNPTKYADGMFRIWIDETSQFSQTMGDPEDDRIRRKRMSYMVEFMAIR